MSSSDWLKNAHLETSKHSFIVQSPQMQTFHSWEFTKRAHEWNTSLFFLRFSLSVNKLSLNFNDCAKVIVGIVDDKM